jgi:Tfp pilus assembly protein PilF
VKTALSRAYLASGDSGRARQEAEGAVALAPHSGFAYNALGLAFVKSKQEEKALEALRRATELEPLLGPARLALAELLLKAGEESLPHAVAQYEAFLRSGASGAEEARVKRLLTHLKKKLAAR